MLLNEDVVDIEKPDRIYSHSFFVEEFSGLFLHQSIFFIKCLYNITPSFSICNN